MSLALECSTISKGGVSALASSRSSVTYSSTSPVAILSVLASRSFSRAGGGHHVLRPQGLGLFKDLPVGLVVKGQLEDAGAVPQVHKDEGPLVPLPLDPAAHRDGLARVAGAQVAAVMGAVEILKIVHENQLRFV